MALWGVMLSCLTACADQAGNTGRIDFESGGGPVRVEPGLPSSCPEGEVRCCDVLLGEHNGVRSCYRGTQICGAGTWSPCADGSVTVHSGVLPPSADCTDNPCDPACQRYDETPDGGISPTGTVTGSFQGGAVENLPSGFQNKGLKDSAHPPASPCTESGDCQFDHRCDAASGLCVPWGQGSTDPSCAGVDLTLGPTCNDIVPVCNRGNTTAPAGVEVIVYSGNQSQMQDNLGLCSGFAGSFAGRCSTSVPIPPGHCVEAAGCPLGGTRSIVVNAPSPPALSAPIAECDCGNNWTAYHNGGPCSTHNIMAASPLEVRQSYQAQCPPGAMVQWGYLSYDAETPSNSSGNSRILIEAQTAESADSFDADCTDCTVLADVPADHPAVCGMGPSPCPIDLFTALGGYPAANALAFELVFTLEPSPDSAVVPRLLHWELSYSCPEVE